MEKIIVVGGLRNKNPSAKVVEGSQVIKGLTDNPFFTDAEDVVDKLTKATNKLSTAIGKKKTTVINEKEGVFNDTYKLGVMYVQSKILGVDPDIARIMVASANLKCKKVGKHEPELLSVTKSNEAHTNDLKRIAYVNEKNKKVEAAYMWRKCEGAFAEEKMKLFLVSTDAWVSDKNVTEGVVTWYDVATVKGVKQSAFCPAVKR
jgi:hypothetical protein